MKTNSKLFVILIITITLTSCASIVFDASIEGNCPSFNTFYNQIQGNENDAILSTKRLQATNQNDDNQVFLSFGAGVRASVPLTDNFKFKTGLIANFKGNKTATGSGASSFENKLNLVYLDIPLLINYQLNDGGINFFGGLQPGILIGAKNKSMFNGNTDTQKVKDQYKTVDIGAVIGGGYAFDNGFGLNLGYTQGLLNILKKDAGGSSLKVKNRMLTLGLTYTFTK